MAKINRSQASAKRIRNLIVVSGLTAIIFSASTYAWFMGMRTVNVSSFDVEVASADSLLLSLNGADWDTSITISSDTFDSASYENNTNKWSGGGLIPMSTVGGMDTGASRMKLFEKSSVTTTPGGYRLMASRVDNYSAPTSEEPDGYVVFDLFIKNFSGTQYIEDLNILDEEAIYLKMDSEVTVSEAGVANTGIENSVRVAFTQVGRVIGTEVDHDIIAGITCIDDGLNKVTGICRTAQIWEPNDTDHETNAISWYDTSCVKRIGQNVTSEDSYSGLCETIANGTSYPTYAVNDAITSADNVDVYDGTEYNSYTPNAKAAGVDTFTDTEKLLTGTARPTFMMLAPNSITKLRIYIYIEGQDIDNYDFASIGKAISVNFGFTKDRFDMEASIPNDEISLEGANESCFDFADGTINGYYDNEGDDPGNPTCPRSFAIPSTIGGETVTTIGSYALAYYDLTGVVIPNTVTTLEVGAFSHNQIEALSIPSSVISIGDSAFVGNQLPDSQAFIYARTDTNLDSIAEIDNTSLNSYGGAKRANVVIPSSVKTMGYSAFGWIEDLTSVTLPDGLISIGDDAFAVNQLSSITIPESVTSIGSGAFSSNALTSVTLPSGLTTIESYAFSSNQLTSITIPNGVTSIGNYAFRINKLEELLIPSSVISVGKGAFNSNQLTSLVIPDSVINLSDQAFSANKLPDNQAFIYARTDTNSDGVAEINTNIITSYGGAKTSNIVIPSGVTTINDYAFGWCSLTSVTLPETLTTIKAGAFFNNLISSITIPSSVTSLGNIAFKNNSLTSVCIKGKANSGAFILYGTDIWNTQPTITWNCTN